MTRRPSSSRAPRCPVCGRPRGAEFKPFCSRRCKDEDLRRWLTGAYAIAGGETADESDESDRGDRS